MITNNKMNVSQENQRGKSVGCRFLQFTGVRFFQPKFLQSLNGSSTIKPQLTKPNIQKTQQSTLKPFTRQAYEKRLQKENIQPVLQIFPQKKAEKALTKKQIKQRVCKIRGLSNIGNTCYMNSLLQCLLNLSKFNSQIMEQIAQNKSKKYDVAAQYKNLLQEFTEGSTSLAFTPSRLKSSIGRKKCRFLGSAQQDAQQFLTAFLQTINEQTSRITQKPSYIQLQNNPTKKSIPKLSQQWWNYYRKRDDSVICDHFQGQLISTVTCNKCKNQSVTFDNIWGLPLSLTKTIYSVSDLISKNWTVDNQIHDYYCSKCQKSRICTKKVQFYRLPQILIIQLKRFQYGKWSKQKIKTSVKLSDQLNLSDCVNPNSQNQNCLYKLSGMVQHYGQVDYGHYTAHAYKQKQRRWYLLNDSKTSQNTPDSPSNTVYLLFYEKYQ